MKWNDVSSYSRGDKDRQPNSFEARAGCVRIRVHRHIDYPGRWCFTSPDLLGSQVHCLEEAKTAAEAKVLATDFVRARLLAALKDMG